MNDSSSAARRFPQGMLVSMLLCGKSKAVGELEDSLRCSVCSEPGFGKANAIFATGRCSPWQCVAVCVVVVCGLVVAIP